MVLVEWALIWHSSGNLASNDYVDFAGTITSHARTCFLCFFFPSNIEEFDHCYWQVDQKIEICQVTNFWKSPKKSWFFGKPDLKRGKVINKSVLNK